MDPSKTKSQITETPNRRLSDFYASRVDVVDQPANKSKFLVVKKKGEVSIDSTTDGSNLLVDGEVDLNSTSLIEKADTTELQAVNAALQIIRPVARGVDGDARTSLVRAIRILEVGFKIAPPPGENQATQPPASDQKAPQQTAPVATPPTQQTSMKKSEGGEMTEQEIKDLVTKSVTEVLTTVEKAKKQAEDEMKLKEASDKQLSDKIKKAVDDSIASLKVDIDEVKKQLGGQASSEGGPIPKVTEVKQTLDGKLPSAGDASSTVVTKAADGMDEGGTTETVAKSVGVPDSEVAEIKKSFGDLNKKFDDLKAALTAGKGTSDGQERVEKSERSGGIWSNVIGGKR